MFINRIIKGRIEIPITSETIAQRNSVLNKASLHERYIIAQSLYRKGKTISEISSILKISEKTVSKYINTKESDIPPERIHSCKKELDISTKKDSNVLILCGFYEVQAWESAKSVMKQDTARRL